MAGQVWPVYKSGSSIVEVDDSTHPLPVAVVSGGGSGTEYVEDAAAAANPQGGMLIGRRKDALSAAEVSADGDNIALNATAKGELYVKQTDTVLVDTELAAAVAAADNLANPTVPQVIGHNELYDPTGNVWNRQRANAELTLLSSAARTATTSSADQVNYNWRGGHFVVNVTVLTTSVVPKIEAKDPISGTYYTLLTGATISSTGITILKLYPGIVAVANAAASDILPRIFRLTMTHPDATTMTYSAAFVGVV